MSLTVLEIDYSSDCNFDYLRSIAQPQKKPQKNLNSTQLYIANDTCYKNKRNIVHKEKTEKSIEDNLV